MTRKALRFRVLQCLPKGFRGSLRSAWRCYRTYGRLTPPSQAKGAGPSEVYTTRLFTEWVEETPRDAVDGTIACILEMFPEARSCADVGCGPGLYANALALRGMDVVAADGSAAAAHFLLPSVTFRVLDFRTGYWPFGCMDLALCLEVGEHIPQQSAKMLVRTTIQAGQIVVFSAAPPGQGGTDHINLQSGEWWRARFEEQGCRYDGPTTRRMRSMLHEHGAMEWIAANVQCFVGPRSVPAVS